MINMKASADAWGVLLQHVVSQCYHGEMHGEIHEAWTTSGGACGGQGRISVCGLAGLECSTWCRRVWYDDTSV